MQTTNFTMFISLTLTLSYNCIKMRHITILEIIISVYYIIKLAINRVLVLKLLISRT